MFFTWTKTLEARFESQGWQWQFACLTVEDGQTQQHWTHPDFPGVVLRVNGTGDGSLVTGQLSQFLARDLDFL